MVGNDHGLAGPSGAWSRWLEMGPAKRWGSRNPRQGTVRRPLITVKNEPCQPRAVSLPDGRMGVETHRSLHLRPTQGTTSLSGLK